MIDRTTCPTIKSFNAVDIQKPECYILPNGIPLNIIKSGEEDLIRMDILINGGIWHQSRPLQALFTNLMLREGTKTKTSSQISEQLDYYGAWIETNTTLNYNFLTLYSLCKYFNKTLAILTDILLNPIFPQDEFSLVLEKSKQQYLINESKVGIIAHKRFHKALFGDMHPCGRFAQQKDYELITVDLLKLYYETFYHSGNCCIFISGKIHKSTIDLIERELGSSSWGKMSLPTLLESKHLDTESEKKIYIEHPNAIQSALRVGGLLVDRKHEDFEKLRVLTTLLGGYFGSRLMSNIREEKGYTYNINANLIAYPYHGFLSISTETGNDYVEKTLHEIKCEIKRLQEEPVPIQELRMVQNYMVGEVCRIYEGALSIPDAWIFIKSAGLPDNYFSESGKIIFQTGPEEIRNLACKYLNPENQIEVVVGKKV